MALIGHVESTAINGNDSPVFEKLAGSVSKQVKVQDAVQLQLAAQAAQIDTLTSALTAFLAANTPVASLGAVVEPELTPQEKANATKAAKKAAEAATEVE